MARRLRGQYRSGLQPAELRVIRQKELKYKLPRGSLSALVSAEHGGLHDTTRSSAGAIGYGQLMPGTAKGMGLDPWDPYDNLEGSARYLSTQLRKFGRLDLALSAYNSGPGGAESSGRVEPIDETQGYVKKVLALMGNEVKVTGDMPGSMTIPAEYGAQQQQKLERIQPGSLGAAKLGVIGPLSAHAQQIVAQRQASLGTQGGGGGDKSTGALPLPDMKAIPDGVHNGWGGTEHLNYQFTNDLGLKSVSEKRDRMNTSTGNVSDHWTGSENAYARDLSGTRAQMNHAAMTLARRFGVKWDGKSELISTITKGGFRYQIIWNTPKYGGHMDHIHFGVRRV